MTSKPIVVGVDNSQGSAVALKWAATEAALRRCPVRAVTCWSLPALYGVDVVALAGLDIAGIEREAAAMLAKAVGTAISGLPNPPVIEQVVIGGLASQEIVTQGKDAEMIVVGSRGHGGFRGLLLGSTATQVIHHAPCPVVVCREEAK